MEHVGSQDFDKRTSVAIQLHFPVTVGGEKYDSLTMRRPKSKDSITSSSFKGSDMKRGILFLASLCSDDGGGPVSPDVIEELDSVDVNQLNEQLGAFMGRQAE